MNFPFSGIISNSPLTAIAVEKGVGEFDFSDDDNYDKEFELDYDGRVQLANFDFTNSQELIEMIVEEVHKLFVEVEDND